MKTAAQAHLPGIRGNGQSNEKVKPTPRIAGKKIPPLNQWAGACVVEVMMPHGGYARLQAACSSLTPLKQAGIAMVASLFWESRRSEKSGRSTMRLVKAAALRFVDRVATCSNPATFVANAWTCEQATQGCNINGKVTNTWYLPPWHSGDTEEIQIRLTARQLDRWNRRHEILRECLDGANPHAAIVRKTLALTKPGPAFDSVAENLTERGERDAIRKYLDSPFNLNLTRDNDVQSNVSRLPEVMRETLQINGQAVAEFDVKSAHAVLLGMFYMDETGEEWAAEKARFDDEVLKGFQSIYGEQKEWKIQFLSALNQTNSAARHASEGYRELERLFPLLAAKVARMKAHDKNAVGRRLRCAMAEIQRRLLIENDADGIPSIPVVDSVVVAMPSDTVGEHRTAIRSAWRLGAPIAELTGTAPLIKGSNGENFRFSL